MTDITRRKFLSLAPASVAAIALGGVALASRPRVTEAMLVEAERATDLVTPVYVRGKLISPSYGVFPEDEPREFVFSTIEPMTIEFTEPAARVYIGIPYTAHRV